MTCCRIGIMGGTFDPVHNAHIQLAQAAMAECRLDKIDFVPSAFPPHKSGSTDADFHHRVKMIQLACYGIDQFFCNEIEATLGTPSYSIDTINSLQSSLPGSNELFFIIGVDAFLEIELWKSFEQVLQRVNFIISPRFGYDVDDLHEFLAELGYKQHEKLWQNQASLKTIFVLDTVPLEVSSTLLKTYLKYGKDIENLVPAPVIEYILKNELYLYN